MLNDGHFLSSVPGLVDWGCRCWLAQQQRSHMQAGSIYASSFLYLPRLPGPSNTPAPRDQQSRLTPLCGVSAGKGGLGDSSTSFSVILQEVGAHYEI